MNHTAKRLLSLLLALIFCVSLFPSAALAEEPVGSLLEPPGEELPDEPEDPIEADALGGPQTSPAQGEGDRACAVEGSLSPAFLLQPESGSHAPGETYLLTWELNRIPDSLELAREEDDTSSVSLTADTFPSRGRLEDEEAEPALIPVRELDPVDTSLELTAPEEETVYYLRAFYGEETLLSEPFTVTLAPAGEAVSLPQTGEEDDERIITAPAEEPEEPAPTEEEPETTPALGATKDDYQFTRQPTGGSVLPDKTIKISWETNFSIDRAYIGYYKSSFLDDYVEVKESSGPTNSFTLTYDEVSKAPEGAHWDVVVIFGSNSGFLPSDDFSLTAVERAFTTQPTGGSVLLDQTITISWETNFSIDRAYIGYYKSSFLDDYVEVKESSGPTNSFTLTYDEVSKAPEGAHWDVVVILGSNSGFLPSDDFSLTAVYAAREFTTQPTSQFDGANTVFIISWETNFTPTKVEIGYKYISSGAFDVKDTITTGLSQSMTRRLPLGKATYTMVVRAYYGDGSYMDSEAFNTGMDKIKFTTQPTSRLSSPNNSFIISWETSFVPTKVEIGYKYISSDNFDVKVTITSGLYQSMTYFLPINKAMYTMVVRAYYGDGSYQYEDSEAFNTGMDKIKFTTQPTSRLSSPNNSFIISWETSFVPTKVEIGYKYISSDNFDVKVTITSGLYQSMTYFLPINKAMYTMVVRAYYGDGSYQYEDSEVFKPGLDKLGFTKQPSFVYEASEGVFHLSWTTNFTPVKVEIGWANGETWHPSEEISTGLAQNMSYDFESDIYSALTFYVRAYYKDYSYEDSEGFLLKPDFTKQPAGGSVNPEGTLSLSWKTNFTPTKVEIGTLVNNRWGPRVTLTSDLDGSMSSGLGYDEAADGEMYIRAYYTDTAYAQSAAFTVSKVPRQFTTQPVGGTVNPGTSYSLNWMTNFTPVLVEVGYKSDGNWNGVVSLEDNLARGMGYSLRYSQAREVMYVRAWYDSHNYAESDPIYMDIVPRQFSSQPAGGTVYPWSTCMLSWTTNFTPVKVEIGILVNTNRWIARATLTSGLQKNMSRALTYDEAADGEMYVRAFYGTGGSDYVASAVFNMEKLDSYVCGDNLTATLDLSTGRLDIVGSGAMYNYSTRNRPPWFEFRSYIKRAELPVGATYIGTYAFYMCGNMHTLAFPPSVTEIGSNAVYDCSSLYWVSYDGFRSQWDRITWNNGNARIQDGSISFLSRTGTLSGTEINWGIYGDQNLLEIDGWGEIPGHMQMPWYEYGEYIEKVIIWNAGITKIGEENFFGCTAMKTIYLPPCLTWIDDAAFNDCTQLRDVYYDGPLYDWNQITIRPNNDPLLDAKLHTTAASNQLTDDVAWSVDDAGLLRIYVTDEFCGSGDQMYIPHFNTSDNKAPWHDRYADLITDVHVESGIGNIGGWAFWDLTKLQTVELAGGVTGISQYAFSGCSALTDIQLPDSITGVAASAFRNCTSLTQIRLPSKAKIWQNTFYGCSKLEKVWLPENAESIPEGYFYNCQKLKEVHIPGTVTSIGKNAFFACNALKTGDVYFNGTSAQWAAITVDTSTTGNTTLLNAGNIHFSPEELRVDAVNFPDESFRAYVANCFDTDGSGWLNADEIAAADYITDEDNDYTTLQGIEYFPNLTGILIDAAPSLTSVDLSANTELNNVDFSGCGNLAEINVSGLNKLHALNVADNALTDLDLRGLTTLQYLAVDENPITELDLSDCSLTELFCRSTSLSSLDLNGQTALFRLYCYGAGIKELDLTGCPLLCEILRDGTRTEKTSDGVPYVEYRLGSTNHVLAIDRDCVCYTENSGIRIDAVNFPDPVFRQYVSLTFDADRSGYLSYEEIEAATAICMEEDYDVHSMQGIGYFTELKTLLVDSNPNLTSLDLTANTGLTKVEVWGNGLTELKLDGLGELKVLNCSNNALTELDVTGLPLTDLDCSRNPMSLLILGEQPELKTLECYGTAGKLILIDIRPCPYLLDAVLEGDFSEPDWGDLYEGPLGGKLFADAGTEILIPGSVSIDVTNFPDETFREFVARYDVNHTQWLVPKELLAVDQIDCSGLSALESLQGVQYFTELVTLICSSCSISTLDLHANTMLEYLEADNMAALTSLNVRGLTGLAYVDVSDCSLTELDVSGCELSYLECDHNPLTSLILGRQEALTSLYCYGVQLAELDLSGCPILLDAWLNGTHTEHDWGLEVNGSDSLGGYMELDKDQKVQTGLKAGVIRSASASFEGKIIMNFYLLLNDEVLADPGAYVRFTGGSRDRKILASDAKPVEKNGETWYQFTYPLVAKEIRDNINLKLYDGDDKLIRLTNLAGTNDYTESGVNYSLLTYCNKMLNSSTSSDKMKALATATIDYCTAAQIYFNYNAEGLSASEAVTSVTLDELQQYKAEFAGTLPTGVVKRTISGVFESDNSLRLYFFFAEGYDPENYQYSIDGASVSLKGIAATTEEGCAMSGYLELSNVASKNLGDLHELTITDGTNSYTVGCSVLTYARSSVANGDEARQNLGKSLYLYYLAAKNYFS